MVKIISLNINGRFNPIKRSKLLSNLKRQKTDMAFLQETHISLEEHQKLSRMGFKYQSSRHLHSNYLFYGEPVNLINVYAPLQSELKILENSLISRNDQTTLDFNWGKKRNEIESINSNNIQKKRSLLKQSFEKDCI